MKFKEWYLLREDASRYSVAVNYKTNMEDVLNGFAKIALSYVSAGMKNCGYHVKLVFDKEPLRILVSSRNWDDGEWVGMISFNPSCHKGKGSFVTSKGFYNKARKSVMVQSSEKCPHEQPSEIVKYLKSMMDDLKSKKDKHVEKLKPVHMKRGPK